MTAPTPWDVCPDCGGVGALPLPDEPDLIRRCDTCDGEGSVRAPADP